MRLPKPLPRPLEGQPFTVVEAKMLGVGTERLRASDLRTPSRSIRVPRGSATNLVNSCRPYLDLLPDAVISHATAARLHGLVLPRRLAEEHVLHLSRGFGKGQSRRRNVVGHRLELSPEEKSIISGLAVTGIARTWLDVAGLLSLEELIVMGDQIVSEHHRNFGPPRLPLVPLQELRAFIEGKHRVAHVRKCRSALERLRVGVDSPPETVLRLMLSNDPQMPEFVPNVAICDGSGEPHIWTDLGCREFRTCLEYDGAHHLTPEQQARDHYRDLKTAELGWVQVKISKTDLARGQRYVWAKVRRGLALAGWRPS
ncbi:endonuclease domain-containing protein [Arthrobacter sunyaminii]|uniref:endonuclease domain-containing protein n=1 Tax=Arthrobacter sunyaminii TaxID=2816859 RepID=UPI001F40361C|nr:hypothetical protein [Arthrobacter sunyaminii]